MTEVAELERGPVMWPTIVRRVVPGALETMERRADGERALCVFWSGEHAYSVTYTAREESCSCRAWEFGHTCYHVMAATVVRAKTGVCSGCGRRFRHRELVECVEGNHDNLTYFHGDQLCPACTDNAGVAR